MQGEPQVPVPVQDPTKDNFFLRLRKKNEDSTLHKKAVDEYDRYFYDRDDIADTSEAVSKRRKESDLLTNHFYNLVTDFYEYGWGESFHFAPMYKDCSFRQNISRHEDYLALKLQLKPGMTVLDVGCGVGGPLREIAMFSRANIVGLNNNEYQVKRCGYLAEKYGLQNRVTAVKVTKINTG